MRWTMKLIGYALLAAIFVLCLKTVPPRIEADLLATTQKSLQENRLDWTMISIDGRDLTLSGSPPTSEAAKKAVELAHQTPGIRKIEVAWLDNHQSRPGSVANVDIAAMEATRQVPVAQMHEETTQLSITLPTQPGTHYEIAE